MALGFVRKITSLGFDKVSDEYERNNAQILNITTALGVLVAFSIMTISLFMGHTTAAVLGALGVLMLGIGLYLSYLGKQTSSIAFCFLFGLTIIPYFSYEYGFTGAELYLLAGGVSASLMAYNNRRMSIFLIASSVIVVAFTLYVLYNHYNGLKLSEFGQLLVYPNIVVATLVIFIVVNYFSRSYFKQQNQLKELDILKSKLISILSHDLRSPLNSIKGVLELYNVGHLTDDEMKPLMADLGKQVNATSGLLEDLLFWVKSQMEGITPNKTKFQIGEMVNESLERAEMRARQKNIPLEVEPMPETYVFADREMIKLAFRNLISNAVKFTPSGKGSIKVLLKQRGEKVILCVKDNGIGIAPDKVEQLKSKKSFTSHGTSNEKGFGIGLMLSSDFIEQNDGQLLIESTKGMGSSFGLELTPIK